MPSRVGPFLFAGSQVPGEAPATSGASHLSELPITSWLLLAQEAEPAPTGPSFLLPLVMIMVLFYFLILRPQKSKDQAMKQLLDNLKEKDHVVTIGGIHGVVTNIQRDQQLVTLRVDESTGAKIKVGTSAIARVVGDEAEDKGDKPS